MALTRTDLESRRLQQMIMQSNLDMHIWSETELQASIDATLHHKPHAHDVWLFAYGSLIWNPAFHFVDRQVGIIYGWHRRFCLWTPVGRGTPDCPGLALGLDRGGSCRGVLYRIAASVAQAELLLVWRREMVVGSYIPRWVPVFVGGDRVDAITFVINPHHHGYAGKLANWEVAQRIARATGQIGSCVDYLDRTVEGLHLAGIRDNHLLQLQRQVLDVGRSLQLS